MVRVLLSVIRAEFTGIQRTLLEIAEHTGKAKIVEVVGAAVCAAD
jgi:hypothetical protein